MVWVFAYLAFLPLFVNAFHDVTRSFRPKQAVANTSADVDEYNFVMPIDHFNKSDARTYNNRYFINDTYYRAGGPVFFYSLSEGVVDTDDVSPILAETFGSTAVMRLARRYHGMAIAWEHRYYGASQPFPETVNNYTGRNEGSYETWRYLTLEQSLEDAAYFAKNFAPPGYTNEQAKLLAPSKTPWIWIGGSYPGSRGAWARLRNPEVWYAVWASSAPVQTSYDGSAYFDTFEASMSANCSADVKAVVKLIDEIMDRKYGEDAFQQLQELVYAVSAVNLGTSFSSLDFAHATGYDEATIAYELIRPWYNNFQSYGPSWITDTLCYFLETYDTKALNSSAASISATIESILYNPGTGNPSDEGIVSKEGANWGLQAYAFAVVQLQAYLDRYAFHKSAQLQTRLDHDQVSRRDEYGAVVARQWNEVWAYQTLTEFGWFQGSLPENITVVSKYYNYTYAQQSQYNQYFTVDDQIPAEPNVNLALDKYGGWNMQPSHVMFTNGEFDPWRSFSVMSSTSDKGAPVRNAVQTIPRCNTAPNGSDVFGLLYPGAVHAQDLTAGADDTDDSPANQGFKLFSAALDEWLPCFDVISAMNSAAEHLHGAHD